MAHKNSKLQNSQDFSIETNQQFHTQSILEHQKIPNLQYIHHPFNPILKLAIKEKMFGNIITSLRTDQSEKLNLIKQRHSSLKKQPQQSLTNRRQNVTTPRNKRYQNKSFQQVQKLKFLSQKPLNRNFMDINNNLQSFISSVDIFNQKIESKPKQQITKAKKIQILPQIRHIHTTKTKIDENVVDQQKWKAISKNGKLKKSLFQRIFIQNLNERIQIYFIRFFDPPFNHQYEQYNQFIKTLINLPEKFKKFILFQIFDQDQDGLITQSDLFTLYKESAFTINNPMFQKQIFKLSQLIIKKNYTIYKHQTIEQYHSTDHSITLSKLLKILTKFHKPLLQLEIKKITTYPYSFQVIEHNEEIKQNKIQLQQIYHKLSQGMHQKNKKQGLSFENYSEIQNELFAQILGKIS